MAYSVSNGAIGKSPLIDQVNHLPIGQVNKQITEKMEQLVCGQKTPIFASVPISFEGCKEELERQLEGLKVYGKKNNGKN